MGRIATSDRVPAVDRVPQSGQKPIKKLRGALRYDIYSPAQPQVQVGLPADMQIQYKQIRLICKIKQVTAAATSMFGTNTGNFYVGVFGLGRFRYSFFNGSNSQVLAETASRFWPNSEVCEVVIDHVDNGASADGLVRLYMNGELVQSITVKNGGGVSSSFGSVLYLGSLGMGNKTDMEIFLAEVYTSAALSADDIRSLYRGEAVTPQPLHRWEPPVTLTGTSLPDTGTSASLTPFVITNPSWNTNNPYAAPKDSLLYAIEPVLAVQSEYGVSIMPTTGKVLDCANQVGAPAIYMQPWILGGIGSQPSVVADQLDGLPIIRTTSYSSELLNFSRPELMAAISQKEVLVMTFVIKIKSYADAYSNYIFAANGVGDEWISISTGDADNSLLFNVSDSPNYGGTQTGQDAFNIGEFCVITAIFDGAASQKYRIRVNGVEQAVTDYGDAATVSPSVAEVVLLPLSDVDLKDFFIWNTRLTEAEILERESFLIQKYGL